MQKALYDDLFQSIRQANDFSYTTCPALAGSKYTGELMVVGRAVNGWIDESQWTARDLFADNDILFEKVRASLIKNECPLKWVQECWQAQGEYNTAKSAFWRVIKRILTKLDVSDNDDWASHIVWSNLYKVAPSKGRNPTERLCKAQEKACIAILKDEILRYRPKRVLFLTGYNWAEPFINALESNLLRMPSEVIDAKTLLHISEPPPLAVIAKHPERKSETPFVEEICRAFMANN